MLKLALFLAVCVSIYITVIICQFIALAVIYWIKSRKQSRMRYEK